MRIDPVDDEVLRLVEAIETAFDACKHPFVNDDYEHAWCNVCGAQRVLVQTRNGAKGTAWLKPHWRDIVARTVFAFRPDK